MALINTISIPISDDAGDTRRVVFHTPASDTLAEIQTMWNLAAPELDALTGGIISAPDVTLALTNPGGLKVTALLDHFNRQGVNIGFGAADTNYRWGQYIPSLRDTLITAGQVEVDLSGFTDWRDRMLSGDAVVLPTNEYGDDLDTFIAAVLSFRK